MAYVIFRKVTTLEFFQHHFAKSGHGDGLLMTRQLISTFRQPPLNYLTRSVRRTSGFVLADHSGVTESDKIGETIQLLGCPGAILVSYSLAAIFRRPFSSSNFWSSAGLKLNSAMSMRARGN